MKLQIQRHASQIHESIYIQIQRCHKACACAKHCIPSRLSITGFPPPRKPRIGNHIEMSGIVQIYRLADTWEPPCGPPFSVLAREVAVQVGVTNPFWQHLHACNMSIYIYLLPACPNMLHQAIICLRTKWIAQGYNGNLQKDIAWTVIAAQTASPATQGINRRGVKKWTNTSIYSTMIAMIV